MTFGERLMDLRKEKGYTRESFAEYLGISKYTLRNYELNTNEPGSKFLKQVSDIFDVSIDYLMGLQDDRERVFPYQLKTSEFEIIKKYRSLDPHGKRMVDFVLSEEVNRIETEPESEYLLQAAHEDSAGATPEQKQHADDIMMDDSEWE